MANKPPRLAKQDTGPQFALPPPDSSFSNRRPGANETNVITNYVRIRQWPTSLFEYFLQFGTVTTQNDTQAVSNRRQKQRILKGLENLPLLTQVRMRYKWASDTKLVWSTIAFPNPTTTGQPQQPQIGQILLFPNIGFQTQSGRNETVSHVQLTLLRIHNLGQPPTFPQLSLPDEPSVIQGLNAIVMKYIAQTQAQIPQIEQVGANKFFYKNGWTNLSQPSETDHEAWCSLLALRGYFISVRRCNDNRILLNINPSTSAFFRPQLVSDFLTRARNQDEAENWLRGVKVTITYQRTRHDQNGPDPNLPVNQEKFITEFVGPVNTQRFIPQSGIGTQTVLSYYQSLGYHPVHRGLPCVNVGAKLKPDKNHPHGYSNLSQAVFIPPEYLRITDCNRVNRTLPDNLTSAMIRIAARYPDQTRSLLTQEGFRLLGITDQTYMQNLARETLFGLGEELLSVPARFLLPPMIQYKSLGLLNPVNASWNLLTERNNPNSFRKFVEPADLNQLHVLKVIRQAGQNSAAFPTQLQKNLYDRLLKCCASHGMNVSQTEWLTAQNQNDLAWVRQRFHQADVKTLEGVLRDILDGASAGVTPICLVILQSPDLYGNVKKIADVQVGINTVCCKSGKVEPRPPDASYLSNLALKFNFKLKGESHHCRRSLDSDWVYDDIKKKEMGTLVLGADVTHPPGGSKVGHPSIAALVGSMRNDFITYAGAVRLQKSRSEIIIPLQEMVKEHILRWAEDFERLPSKILFYRDGVSESQYAAVREHEIRAVREAWKSVAQAKPKLNKLNKTDCQITFIIVGKRHHTRFFPRNPQDQIARNNSNLKPGLIVDSVVTRGPVLLGDGKKIAATDFYLQSHQARQGTGRSAHYVVLQNEIQNANGQILNNRQIQNITHIFCYTYSRSTGAVSYCTPAYYADRLCTRARAYFKDCEALVGNPPNKLPNETALQYQNRFDLWLTAQAQNISHNQRWNPRMPPNPNALDLVNVYPNPWVAHLQGTMFWL